MSNLFNDDFIDVLSVVSFIVGIMNYEENLSQSDKDDIIRKSSEDAQRILEHIDKHVDDQNSMLRDIISRLEKLEDKYDLWWSN